MSKHVIKYYVDWSEKRLSAKQAARVEQHLHSCAGCRRYFEKMDAIFSPADPAALPQLQPDPLLPTRIRALARQRSTTERANPAIGSIFANKLQLGLSGMMMIAAIGIGVYLGKSLATPVTGADTSISESELVAQYYDTFSYESFTESWETIVSEEGNGTISDEVTP